MVIITRSNGNDNGHSAISASILAKKPARIDATTDVFAGEVDTDPPLPMPQRWGDEDCPPVQVEDYTGSHNDHGGVTQASTEPREDRHQLFELKTISSADFAVAEYQQTFLIDRVLVEGQPAIVGGKYKTLKTSVLVDLAISLGAGVPFLDHFCSRRCKVTVLSGESGAFTLQETAKRVADSKGVDLADCEIRWGFELPQLGRADHVRALENMAKAQGSGVVIIDPAYLCLMSGDNQGKSASDIFHMGMLLRELSLIMDRTGTTIILCHHCRKNTIDPYSPPELEELSMAGFAEWARQWILLGRREQYEKGSGDHKLWMNIGGSAGHSGCYALTIAEGEIDSEFKGRRWEVGVEGVTEARVAEANLKASKKAKADEAKEDGHRRKLLAAIKQAKGPRNASQLREVTGLTAKPFGIAVSLLLKEGRVKEVEMVRRGQTCDGYEWTGK